MAERPRLTPEAAAEELIERARRRWGEARAEAIRALGPAVPAGPGDAGRGRARRRRRARFPARRRRRVSQTALELHRALGRRGRGRDRVPAGRRGRIDPRAARADRPARAGAARLGRRRPRARAGRGGRARPARPPRGRLHGVPLGIKDIFDVAGLPTEAGFAPFHDRVASADCTAVARLREAGAVILGKTVTTQFAYMDPPPTRNPWRAERTPGGSSSGSGAAVAARMVPGRSARRPAARSSGRRPTRRGRAEADLRAGQPARASWRWPGASTIPAPSRARSPTRRSCSARSPATIRPTSRAALRPVDDYVGRGPSAAAPPRLVVLDDFVERAQPDARAGFESNARPPWPRPAPRSGTVGRARPS